MAALEAPYATDPARPTLPENEPVPMMVPLFCFIICKAEYL